MYKPKKQLYVDLDGVLTDYAGFCKSELGLDVDREAADPPELWAKLAAHGMFYADLPMLPDALFLWASIQRFHRAPIILTGIPKSVPDAGQQKTQWVQRKLAPVPEVIVCQSRNKYLHGKPGDVLIDDWTPHRDRWERMGGTFIHHTSAKSTIEQLAAVDWNG